MQHVFEEAEAAFAAGDLELTVDLELPVWTPLRTDLGEIRVPTLVLVGDRDMAAMRVVARKLVEGISRARLEVIEGADHLPNMRKPEDFNRLVLGFLDDLGKQPANGP